MALTSAAALTLAACGGSGSGPETPLPPTAVLNVSATAVNSGGSSTLTWSSANATSCTASGGWSGAKATSGTQSTGALTSNTTFSLKCTGAGGTSTPAAVTVTVTANVLPTVTLSASPTSVVSGAASTLTWKSTNATSCTASGGWSGAKATSGTQSTGALTANSTFSLNCTGAGGTSAPAAATVTVAAKVLPTVTLSASPTSVVSGAASTLTWSSTNATSCTASGGWSGTKATSGTQSTGALTASATYSLTCAGPGGTSSAATATVTISTGTVTVSPKAAAITLWQTQQFTATVPGGGTATWSVDTIAGGNSAVGTINATGLYTPGTVPGTHTILAASGTDSGTATLGVTNLAGVYTYHNDLARDGANTQEYGLNPGNVNAAGFGKLTPCAVDGAVYAQPLWVANLTVGGAKHNVVFVATEHDSVYAFDADTSPCVQLWQAALVTTSHGANAGETSVPYTLVGNGNGDTAPEIGVTSTPVIDPATGILYVLAKSTNSTQTVFYQRLHALNLTTGNEMTGSPVLIAGTYPGAGDGGTTVTFNALMENQRAGLALVNGVVYIAWGSHGDTPPFYGWMMGYRYTGAALTQQSIFNAAPNGPVAPTAGGAGIWMSGSAPAADSNNNLYVVTGNGAFDTINSSAPNDDYGDSLLQLSTGLTVSQYYTPAEQSSDGQSDYDLGAGGTAVLVDLPATSPFPHLLICGGKSGNLYVVNRDALGGYDPGYTKMVQRFYSGNSLFSTGAFWNNNYYIAAKGTPLSTYTLSASTSLFTTSGTPSSSISYKLGGGTPSVSSAATANGIVWALDNALYCTFQSPGCGPTVLHAYDATNIASELWNSGTNPADSAGDAVKFTFPTIANGKVYVGTRGNNGTVPGELDIYALKP